MICGPRIQSSPRSPSATSSPVSGSTIRHSVPGTGGPIDPARSAPGRNGITWVTGLVSVSP